MRAPLAGGLAALLIAALVGTAAGCDDDDDGGDSPQAGGLPAAGGGGDLRYAVPEVPTGLDPLEADTRNEQLVSRQVYEPLVGSIRPPYGGEATRVGLAASVTPSPTRAEWTIVLRRGLRFHDGTPLDVTALLANARRWITSPAGGQLLPGAFDADSPRPGAVRLLFDGPVSGVPALLDAPQLGVVSPAALESQGGDRSRLPPGATQAGTGPFQLNGRMDGSLELARNAGWWGSPLGLGPALDSVTFVDAPAAPERVALLEAGDAEVADAIGPRRLAAISADPLLRSRGGPGGIAYVASVRGLEPPPAIPALSGVWLTNIEG